MPRAGVIIGAAFLAAIASACTLAPLLGVSAALTSEVHDFDQGLAAFVQMTLLALLTAPFVIVCFMIGALTAGLTAYAALHQLNLAGRWAAGGAGASVSGLAMWLLYGFDRSGEALWMIIPVAGAGAIGGLVFRHVADNDHLKPPPAPPS